MQTIISKTGIEVCYPCTVHLLQNGENYECEYKSDDLGQDLLNHICRIQNIDNQFIWGLKFMDNDGMEDQRHWLDLDNLIRTQVRTVSNVRFYFRVKVYPPEPYRIIDGNIRFCFFQQLRLDLLSGRLFCSITDASMLTALILQYVHGNFDCDRSWTYNSYIKQKILRQERCSTKFFSNTKFRALDIYEKLLPDLKTHEVEDMFLRLAGKLNSYGVEPLLVQNLEREDVILWMNYSGFSIYSRRRKLRCLTWNEINTVTHEGNRLLLQCINRKSIVFICMNPSECTYIWSLASDHLTYFTATLYINACVGVHNYYSNTIETFYRSSKTFPTYISENNEISHIKKLLPSKKELLELNISKTLLQMLDVNVWRSQFPVIYVLIILYVMGSHSTIFADLPGLYSIRTGIHNMVSKILFNKVVPF